MCLQKKDEKYLEKFTKEIVVITLQPGPWWQKLSDTDSFGLQLSQMQNISCEVVMDVRDMLGKPTCQLRN